ncbi:hypothetical protein [Maribacter hydrothermalis]|nr:hypothetical protein [Maribacter hydrothermalis]
MKQRFFFIVFLLCMSVQSCKQDKKITNVELFTVWSNFLNTLEKNDKVAFKKASGKTIRCYDCLENTPSEVQKMILLRDTDSLWYDKIYDDLIYIPVDSFILKDFDLLFNPQFVQLLRDNETTFIDDNENNVRTVHFLVTTTPPTLNFEGGQHSFSFVKKADGQWTLNEISTIP